MNCLTAPLEQRHASMCNRCGIDLGSRDHLVISMLFCVYRGLVYSTCVVRDMSLYISAYMAAVVAKNAASAHGCIKRCWPPHRTHTSWCPTVPSTSTCLGVDVQPRRPHRCIRAPLFSRTVHIDVHVRYCSATPSTSMRVVGATHALFRHTHSPH